MQNLRAQVDAASAAFAAGKRDQALFSMRRLVASNPAVPEVYFTLGTMLMQTGLLDQAEHAFRRTVELRPASALFAVNLGNVLLSRARPAEARPFFDKAIAADSRYAPAWTGLSLCQISEGDASGAEASCRRAIELDPARLPNWTNLSGILQNAGRMSESLETLRGARARFPGHPTVLLNHATLLNYLPHEPREIHAAHVELGRNLAAAAPPSPPLTRPTDPDKRLRIAYISPDLRDHSVARFVEPIFSHHDRAAFEVRAYFTFPRPDAVSERLKSLADAWTDAAALSPAQLLNTLRGDQIDIVVELSGATAGNRLSTLAARAAPIQITAIGYPNTTGIAAMDFRMVDSLTDPAGDPYDAQAFATERLLRVDPCFLCFQPPSIAPDPSPLSDRPITFGSFNAIGKLSDASLDLWARILLHAPGSRLILKNRRLSDAATREHLAHRLQSRGVGPGTFDLLGEDANTAAHLLHYQRIDIALDPFPYNGTTTTCEALWMGVPVISLRGNTHAGRVGLSLLSAAGVPEFAARDADEYERLAVSLAQDRHRLATYRAGLRERVRTSALCDAKGYTARLETALRSAWRERCAAQDRP